MIFKITLEYPWFYWDPKWIFFINIHLCKISEHDTFPTES